MVACDWAHADKPATARDTADLCASRRTPIVIENDRNGYLSIESVHSTTLRYHTVFGRLILNRN